MAVISYESVLHMAQSLSRDEQLRLIEELLTLAAASDPAHVMELRRRLVEINKETEGYLRFIREVPAATSASSSKPTSVLDLYGLGAEIWQNVDAQEYVRQERDSWHG